MVPESAVAVMPEAVTLAHAAKVLGMSRTAAYTLNAQGAFPVRVLKIGGRYRVSIYDLNAYLNKPPAADGAEAAAQ